ncbi:penicillin-binding protein activator [Marinomonas vulgaris]|nr:penicillin-binding protein activator [Marinomonas vulgaris]
MDKTQSSNQTDITSSSQQERTPPPSIYHPLSKTAVSESATKAYQDAQNLYQQAEYQQALDTLNNNVINTDSNVKLEGLLLAALAASKLNMPLQAQTFLKQAEQLPAASHPNKQNAIKETRASLLEQVGDWIGVVNLRMDMTYSLPLNEEGDNQAKLWLAIQNLTQNEMDELTYQQAPVLSGWLTISNILRDQSQSIEQQLAMFEQWQIANPTHPAALSPPQDFQIMSSVEEMAPSTIVLMLPMSGPLERASQAIVEGFFASFYLQKEARPQVHIINTEDYSNIRNALTAANEKQPDIIIGPLQKNNVAQISRLPLPYPVIALNQLDVNQHPNNLYHFSLTAEDDIHELITFAKQNGASKAAILSTQDTWALKQSDEFQSAATTENVTVTSNQAYANTPRGRQEAIQKLLLVDESYARRRSIERWIGTEVDSIGRSREDLDYVYYVGKLNDAKQIRPLLDFYFANKIPMLASSTLNDNPPEKSTKAEDIERILFTEMPALLPANDSLSALSKNQNSNILRRLQALGADAFLLANKYQLFTLLPSTKIAANTGIITMDEKGIFHKRPEIMTYRKGNLVYAHNQTFFEQKEGIEQ